MKVRVFYILVIATALAAVPAYRFLMRKPPPPTEIHRLQPPAEEVKPEKSVARTEVVNVAEPEPAPVEKIPLPPVKAAAPPARKPPRARSMTREEAVRRYWEGQARNFARQQERLDREEDPARRLSLIQSMSRYVRVDTLRAIDWAMSVADPEERRAALEAINNNSLSGIGARIGMDETGIPQIQETTILSAVGATGLVEPGDYIVGMEDGNGQSVYFEDLSVREVTQFLRGQPGTEVRLLMERAPAGDNTSYPFDVTVQRSLLVIQPPF